MIYANFDSNLKSNTETFSGIGGAMLEACESDMAMFKAMLKLDAIEIKLNEAAGEDDSKESIKDKAAKAGKMASAAASNIMKKIASMLEWLGDKINQAAAAAVAQFTKLTHNDEALIKNKIKNVNRENLHKITIEGWKKIKNNPFTTDFNVPEFTGDESFEDKKMYEDGYFFGEAESIKAGNAFVQIEEFFSSGAGKALTNFAKQNMLLKRKLSKKAAEFKKRANAAKNTESAEEATKAYKNCQSYRNYVLDGSRTKLKAMRDMYSMYRKGLVKCLSNPKSEAALVEYAMYAAEEEVDNLLECVFIGGKVSDLYKPIRRKVGPEIKPHSESYAELMNAVSAPLF